MNYCVALITFTVCPFRVRINYQGSRFEKFSCIYKNILKKKLTDSIFNDLCKRFQSLVFEEVIMAPYVKGAKEFLDHMARRYVFFICSGTPQEELEMIIDRRGMRKYFSSLHGSPTNKNMIVRKILQDNAYRSGDVLYVGDALSDYEAARENNVFFVGRLLPGSDIFRSACDTIPDLTFLEAAICRIENKF